MQWKYSVLGDTQIVNHDQIMLWKVESDWDLTASIRVMKFIFLNFIQIRYTLDNLRFFDLIVYKNVSCVYRLYF